MEKIIINAQTGEAKRKKLTKKEQAARLADEKKAAAKRIQREEEAVAKEQARNAAVTKLEALGLTQEEIRALIGDN